MIHLGALGALELTDAHFCDRVCDWRKEKKIRIRSQIGLMNSEANVKTVTNPCLCL